MAMCIAAYRLEHLGYLIAVLSSCFSGLDNSTILHL